MSVTIKLRKGLASEWAANNSIVLASGEPGLEIDTGRLKIGNGTTQWGSLQYASIIPTGFLAGSGIDIDLGTNGATATISVSGLINNPANDRILTSRDNTTTGIDAESNLTFNKNYLIINSSGLRINQAEGNGTVAIDVTSGGDNCFSLVPQTPQSSGYMAFGIHSQANISPFNVSTNNLTGYSRTKTSDLIATSGFLNQVVFNTGLDDPNLLAGQLQWNSTEGTLDLGLNDNYAMHLGEEMLYRVRNTTGSTLLAGSPIYASGLSPGGNNRIEVNLYAADGTIREIRFMGLITEDLPDGGNNGYATHFGYIRGIDTRGNAATYGTTNKLWSTGEPAWNEGDILYVHPTVPGKLTKIEPKHSISVAIVTNVASNGKLFVRPTSYGHLDDNHDVNVSGVSDGQYLQYNAATDYWIPTSSGTFSVVNVDNLRLDGNTLSSTSGNIIINPSGTGALQRDSGGNARGQYAADWQTVRSTGTMVAGGDYSVIGGGRNNTSSGSNSTVGGGYSNTASSYYATVGGGNLNQATSQASTVAGGRLNSASNLYSTVGGGISNQANGEQSVVAGGTQNVSSGFTTSILGGQRNAVSGNYSAILGGADNDDNGHNNVFILGSNISATQPNTTFVENLDVATSGDIGTLKINNFYHQNLAVATGIADNDLLIAVVDPTGSPTTEVIQGSVLRSSLLNQPAQLQFRQGTDAERLLITPASGEPIWTTDTQKFYIGDGSTVGGDFVGPSPYDRSSGTQSITALNTGCVASGNYSVVGGGRFNTSSGSNSTVGGGNRNTSSGYTSTISGGYKNNTGNGSYSTVGGGAYNTSSGSYSTVCGGGSSVFSGFGNQATASRSTVGGGTANTSNGSGSVSCFSKHSRRRNSQH